MTVNRSAGLAAGMVAAVLAAAGTLGACGGAEGDEAQAARGSALAGAAALERDPYAISCAHVRDQMSWAKETRQATVAIADRERIPAMTRLKATQSLYYAMTEVCKGRPASFAPARAAVRGVRSGTYVTGR